MERSDILLEATSLEKAFGGVRALQGVDFVCRKGEIVGLFGANGAGKSTLVKVLSGTIRPDAGVIRFEGKEIAVNDPRHAQALGIVTVYQELTVLPHLTVAQNVFLIDPPTRFGLVDSKRLFSATRQLFGRLGISDLDPGAIAQSLPLADRQLIEIARALSRNPKLLILDEGASALTHAEVDRLFELLLRLKEEGTSIIYITHRLGEAQRIIDRIEVLRDGMSVGRYERNTPASTVLEAMLGRRIEQTYPPRRPLDSTSSPLLKLHGITAPGLSAVSFEVRAGEVLGLAGLEGQGQIQLLMYLGGQFRWSRGFVTLRGRKLRIHSPWQAKQAGFALIPEDRKTEGLLLDQATRINLTLTTLGRLSVPFIGYVSAEEEKRRCSRLVADLQIKVDDLESPTRNLSGGHQQKVLLAKWLETNSSILLLSDPTRGIDVGTKMQIYGLISALSQQGKCILLYSTELTELVELCHRVLVFHRGTPVAELSGDDLNETAVLAKSLQRNRCAD
jgi:ribose transport system ATP-binding protein